MGYRSDVMAVFYTYDPNEYPAMKLFIDENVPEFFRSDEYVRVFGGRDNSNVNKLHGIKFTMNGMKERSGILEWTSGNRMLTNRLDAQLAKTATELAAGRAP